MDIPGPRLLAKLHSPIFNCLPQISAYRCNVRLRRHDLKHLAKIQYPSLVTLVSVSSKPFPPAAQATLVTPSMSNPA